MSKENTVSRRGLFKGAGLGLVAGIVGSRLLHSEKTCLNEALPAGSPASREAMRELINVMNDYDQEYIERGFSTPDERDFAEGERYLTHLIRVGAELFLERGDEHPEFVQIVTPTLKLMGDNPDSYYFHSQIRGDRNYRIRGQRRGEVYISLTVHTGDEPGGWATGVATTLNDRQFNTDAEGNFELMVGPTVSGANSLKTTADSISIITRHYYLNENYAASDPTIHPQMVIENIHEVAPPAAPTDQSMAERIRALTRFVRANSIDRPLMNPLDTPDWFSLIPNRLGQPAKWSPDHDAGGWGAIDNAYAAGRFELAPDEALVIEGIMPKCIFANVMLWNRYLQTFDYRYRQVSLNRKQMQLEADGSFRIVVAHQDPGIANWLDTEQRDNGIIYWRFLMPSGELAAIDSRVVRFSELNNKG